MKALKKLFGLPERTFTVFVVEDSEVFRDLLSHFIEDIDSKKNFNGNVNYEVYSFQSGEECLLALQDKKPDIVILDYQLDAGKTKHIPGVKAVKPMNGLETLEAIKKVMPTVEAVMVTAKGNFSVNTSALDAGAAEYIEKGPGIREKLQETVAALMKKILGETPPQPAIS